MNYLKNKGYDIIDTCYIKVDNNIIDNVNKIISFKDNNNQ